MNKNTTKAFGSDVIASENKDDVRYNKLKILEETTNKLSRPKTISWDESVYQK